MNSTRVSAPGTLHLTELAASLLDRLRADPIRVHAITNTAAQNLTANLLLAAGAIPSLTIAPEEVSAFTGRANALLINLGTLDQDRCAAIPQAIETARAQGKPWVLDPVFAEASPPRLAFARWCLEASPRVLRCNANEFAALSEGGASTDAVRNFACGHRIVVALTGPVDLVTDGSTIIHIENGHHLMSRVTAMGCAGTALIAAFAALHPNAAEAAASALLATGIAGEVAAEHARGPGTFQPAFLDALFNLDKATLAARGRIS
jgi:hydroxyethylthiazole kinase